jgi:uncharacterized membrane protein
MVEAIALWLHGTLGGKFLLTLLISMIPVLELRGGVPAGVAMGLPIPLAFLAGLVGNMSPVPFIILFARQILRWLYEHIPALANLTRKIETRAAAKSKQAAKYKTWGLLLLVAIPLPGTGAWTGALVAAMMRIRLRRAFPAVALGVVIAAFVVSVITYGARMVF